MYFLRPLKNIAWKLLYQSWGPDADTTIPGYTALLPVPADLPIFIQLALDNIESQDHSNLAEVIVIPDIPSNSFRRIYNKVANNRHMPPIRLVEMSVKDRLIGQISRHPGTYHFLQLVRGIESSRTSHILFHDADLFFLHHDYLRKHYELSKSKGVNVLGVRPARRNMWRDRENWETATIAATWEMMARRDWLKRYKTHQHRGQKAVWNGRMRVFDTTILPQWLSCPDEIAISYAEHDLIHFTYTISSYRHYCRLPRPFNDKYFRILLLRLLVDALDNSGWTYHLPPLENIIEGIAGNDKFVSYVHRDTKANYARFSRTMMNFLDSGALKDKAKENIYSNFLKFDRQFRDVQ